VVPCCQGRAWEASSPARWGVGNVEAWRVEANRDLDRLRAEVVDLQTSRRRLVLAEDAERRRIERDLHQGVQQHLVALAANLQLAAGLIGADPPAAKALLEELTRDVGLALDEARELARRIYPPLLDSGGLAVAIRSAAASADVPARLHVDAHAAYPPEVARTVYRCCLEVLERAAADTEAVITVRDEAAAVHFEIVAECGRSDLETVVRDRVEGMGGRLTIGSQAGRRTRVAGSIPLAE
jgi:signal transduction histidine kinase